VYRRFCDVCGKEITDDNMTVGGPDGRSVVCKVPAGKMTLSVEARPTMADGSDHGDMCKYCIIDAVKHADDRETSVEERSTQGHIPPKAIPRPRALDSEEIAALARSSAFKTRCCSGEKKTGRWRGHRCCATANYQTPDGKWWCKNHLPLDAQCTVRILGKNDNAD